MGSPQYPRSYMNNNVNMPPNRNYDSYHLINNDFNHQNQNPQWNNNYMYPHQNQQFYQQSNHFQYPPNNFYPPNNYPNQNFNCPPNRYGPCDPYMYQNPNYNQHQNRNFNPNFNINNKQFQKNKNKQNKQGPSNDNKKMKTDHIKEENNKADFFCEKCDREFKTVEKYKEHCDTHRVCGVNGCKFEAAEKLVKIHFNNFHASGIDKKIPNL